MPFPEPTMPRSTSHLQALYEREFRDRRTALARELVTPSPARLGQVLAFVRSHDQGRDAYLDEQHSVVRWSMPDPGPDGEWCTIPCAAASIAEAKRELEY
jgi:hypothetical protein